MITLTTSFRLDRLMALHLEWHLFVCKRRVDLPRQLRSRRLSWARLLRRVQDLLEEQALQRESLPYLGHKWKGPGSSVTQTATAQSLPSMHDGLSTTHATIPRGYQNVLDQPFGQSVRIYRRIIKTAGKLQIRAWELYSSTDKKLLWEGCMGIRTDGNNYVAKIAAAAILLTSISPQISLSLHTDCLSAIHIEVATLRAKRLRTPPESGPLLDNITTPRCRDSAYPFSSRNIHVRAVRK